MRVYTLHEPSTGELRYIGITHQPLMRRLQEHLYARNGKHRARWIAKIGKPEIRLLHQVLDYPAACLLERFFIASARYFGFRLVNSSGGGEGVFNPSEECREVLSAAAKARMAKPETKLRSAQRQRDLWTDPVFREKTSAAIRASRKTAKAKQVVTLKERWADPVFAVRMLRQLKEAKTDADYKVKQREGVITKWADPEFRARQSAGVKANWVKRKAGV